MGIHNSLLVVERREGNLYEVNKEEGSTLDVVFLPNFSYFIAPFSYSLSDTTFDLDAPFPWSCPADRQSSDHS